MTTDAKKITTSTTWQGSNPAMYIISPYFIYIYIFYTLLDILYFIFIIYFILFIINFIFFCKLCMYIYFYDIIRYHTRIKIFRKSRPEPVHNMWHFMAMLWLDVRHLLLDKCKDTASLSQHPHGKGQSPL